MLGYHKLWVSGLELNLKYPAGGARRITHLVRSGRMLMHPYADAVSRKDFRRWSHRRVF